MYSINKLLGYSSSEDPVPTAQSPRHIDILLSSLVEDIGNLLHTRPQAYNSHVCDEALLNITDYGIPDLSHYNPFSGKDQDTVCDLLLSRITRFEPRVRNCKIRIHSRKVVEEGRFHFLICGTVLLGQEEVAIVLESKQDIENKRFKVNPLNAAG